MKQLLRFEFRKLFRSKAFYVCTIISIVFILISALTVKAMASQLKEIDPNYNTTYTGLSMIKDVFNNGQISLLGGIMTAILVTEDYTSDTIKNVYARGYTRQNVFYAKVVSGLVAFLIMFFVDILLSFVFGTFMFDGLGTAGSNYIGAFFGTMLIVLAYFSIFFTISYLFRKLSLAITFCIVMPIGVNLLLALGDTLVSKVGSFKFTNYWLDGRLVQMAHADVAVGEIVGAVVMSLVVIAAMTVLVSFVNRKRDA